MVQGMQWPQEPRRMGRTVSDCPPTGGSEWGGGGLMASHGLSHCLGAQPKPVFT